MAASGSGHRKYRSKTPEILLSPHHLDNSRIYYDYYDPRWRNGPSYHPQGSVEPSGSPWDRTYTVTSTSTNGGGGGGGEGGCGGGAGGGGCGGGGNFKSYRNSSDIDSQVSLPRSYTLPREFKYKKPKARKAIRTEHFIHSTNSSDGNSADDAFISILFTTVFTTVFTTFSHLLTGDVDSGDDNDGDEGHPPEMPPHPHALPYAGYGNRNRLQSPFRGWGLPNQHETKL